MVDVTLALVERPRRVAAAGFRPVEQERFAVVDRYIADLLMPADAALEALFEAGAAAGLPPRGVTRPRGSFCTPWHEPGSPHDPRDRHAAGYSTIGSREGAAAGRHADHARGGSGSRRGRPRQHRPRWPVRHGRASRRSGARVSRAARRRGPGPFELTPSTPTRGATPSTCGRSSSRARGSVIIADNVARGGDVIDAAKLGSERRGVRRFLELLAAEPRVSATAVQTVGARGYDAFAIALVTTDRVAGSRRGSSPMPRAERDRLHCDRQAGARSRTVRAC